MYTYDIYINSDNKVNKPQNSLSSSKVMGNKKLFYCKMRYAIIFLCWK